MNKIAVNECARPGCFPRSGRRSYWKCAKDCPECEGKGYVVVGDIAGFNPKTMEVYHKDELGACENAEWFDPDEDS